MPRSISTVILGSAGHGRGPTVPLQGRETLDSPSSGDGTEKGTLECGFQAGELCRAQLPDWGGDDSSGVRSSGRDYQVVGPVEE